jgi:phenylacetate-CoA ligase
MLDEVWERNRFYIQKFRDAGLRPRQLRSIEDLAAFPFTTRVELLADQTASPPLGTNLGCPISALSSICCSSGTSGAPILWGDTLESWQWIISCSQALYVLAGIQPTDRIQLPPLSAASSAQSIQQAGARALGCACLLGQASPNAHLKQLRKFRPTVLIGTPNQLLLWATAAEEMGTRPDSLGVSSLILTGKPSRQTLRPRLEQLWAAQCFDRYGLTEAGSVAGECPAHCGGMHILESEFIAEVIHPQTGALLGDGERGELVLTNLGRVTRPIIRYRTGDLVRLVREHQCPCGRTEALLMGDVVRINGMVDEERQSKSARVHID